MNKQTYLGIDIGGTSIVAALITKGNIEKKVQTDTLAKQNLAIILKQLYSIIDQLISPQIKGIGIGCPGFIDSTKGTIVNINNIPAFKGVNLVDLVHKKYQLPVFINNDANCFVLGETYFGAGKGFKHVLGITLGTGLGGGIVINKKIHGGLCGAAGEIGCIPFKESIAENYASSHFFHNNYQMSGYDLFLKAEAGDKSALATFEQLGKNIGEILNMVMYVIAPELIVIGGSIAKSFKYIEPGIKAAVNNFLFDEIKTKVHIKAAELENAGLVGAATLCLSEME